MDNLTGRLAIVRGVDIILYKDKSKIKNSFLGGDYVDNPKIKFMKNGTCRVTGKKRDYGLSMRKTFNPTDAHEESILFGFKNIFDWFRGKTTPYVFSNYRLKEGSDYDKIITNFTIQKIKSNETNLKF